MNTDTNQIEKKTQSIIDSMVSSSKKEKHKLVEELWEYCMKFPNDYELGKNLRMFILTQTMK